MSYLYDKELGVKWVNVTFFIMMILVLVLMVKPFIEKISYNKETEYCEVPYCSKTTLDQFENCKDIGIENTGFLTTEHFYLCDGQRVTKSCIEYSMKEFDGEMLIGGLGSGMKCTPVNKQKKVSK